jgi:hypothetical protein
LFFGPLKIRLLYSQKVNVDQIQRRVGLSFSLIPDVLEVILFSSIGFGWNFDFNICNLSLYSICLEKIAQKGAWVMSFFATWGNCLVRFRMEVCLILFGLHPQLKKVLSFFIFGRSYLIENLTVFFPNFWPNVVLLLK